jgi:hypothetical protein
LVRDTREASVANGAEDIEMVVDPLRSLSALEPSLLLLGWNPSGLPIAAPIRAIISP